MRHCLTTLLAFLTLGSTALAQTSDALDAFIAQQMAASDTPGLAYAVVNSDQSRVEAAGVLRAGEDSPVTPRTLFRIGSVSKSFTALAIMQLKDRGALSLEDEVSRHLAVFETVEPITLRQLLGHASGYSTVQGNIWDPDETLSDQVVRLARTGPARAPGERWAYSNANYQILGAVIEAVSGQAYADYVDAHIFTPAGMHDSNVLNGWPAREMATGHQPWFSRRRPQEARWGGAVIAPAGGVLSSAADMAIYLQIMVNGEDDLVSAQSKADMFSPASAASPFYGLGWARDPESGYVFHSGLTPGSEAIAVLDPARGRGVVVLVNASGGMGFNEVEPLLYGVANLALGEPYGGPDAGWGRKSLFVLFLVMPVLYAVASFAAWSMRDGLRAKSGVAGLFSLWFPLVASGVLAVVLLRVLPGLFGTTLGSLSFYQPDLVVLLYATVVSSAFWAVFRLALAHTGKAD